MELEFEESKIIDDEQDDKVLSLDIIQNQMNEDNNK